MKFKNRYSDGSNVLRIHNSYQVFNFVDKRCKSRPLKVLGYYDRESYDSLRTRQIKFFLGKLRHFVVISSPHWTIILPSRYLFSRSSLLSEERHHPFPQREVT